MICILSCKSSFHIYSTYIFAYRYRHGKTLPVQHIIFHTQVCIRVSWFSIFIFQFTHQLVYQFKTINSISNHITAHIPYIHTRVNARIEGRNIRRILGFGSGAQGQGTFNLVYNLNGICGNNIIEFSEECDDGNLINGDGCSATCSFENAGNAKGVAINEDAVRANPSSMLDVKSDSKGVLIPRLTTAQRTSIATPAIGLIVFDISTKSFWYYKTGGWSKISGSSGTGFSAFNGSNQAFTAQFDPTVPSEIYDDGNNFASGAFTVPVFAIYQLGSFATFTFTSVSVQTVITLSILNKTTSTIYSSNSIIIPAGFSGTVRLNTGMSTKINAGSLLGVRVQVAGSPGTQQLSYIEFSGYKVY